MALPTDNGGNGGTSPARIPENEWPGTYRDAVEGLTDEQKWPLKQVPQAPAPTPFRIGG
jgi:hypothetical protein